MFMSLEHLGIRENQCIFLHLKVLKGKKSYLCNSSSNSSVKCFHLFKIFSFYLILSTKQSNELSRISNITPILMVRKLTLGQQKQLTGSEAESGIIGNRLQIFNFWGCVYLLDMWF